MNSYTILIDSVHHDCIPNLICCARFYRYLINNGHKVVKKPSEADFIIINSCGFSKQLQNQTIAMYQKYNNIKKEETKIIIYGCLVNINPEIFEDLPLIKIGLNEDKKIDTIFLNTTKFENIEPYCTKETKDKLFKDKKEFSHWFRTPFLLTKIFIPFSKKLKVNYKNMIKAITYNNCNFIEISKGCTGNCSYCLIKKAKGEISSRTIQDIISNIKDIYDPSKPLFLAADDCASYGADKNINFIELFYEINPWLEKYYNEYVKLFSSRKINLVILPIQSGSQKIVNKMNRRYNVEKLLEKINYIKKTSPNTILYAHFIIGFPGESIIDFIKTLFAIKYFDYPVAFIYSNEKGTKSYSMPNQKSKYVIFLRFLIFLFFVNFVIYYRLNHYSKIIEFNRNNLGDTSNDE